MAILDNEKLTAPLPERPSRGPRNRGVTGEVIENKEDDKKGEE